MEIMINYGYICSIIMETYGNRDGNMNGVLMVIHRNYMPPMNTYDGNRAVI